MFDPDSMRKRFHELGAKRDAIMAVSSPLREKRDALAAKMDAELKELATAIKAAEVGLFEIDQERGSIAKFLNGKTGAA
jgi:hypothetical protein